MNEDESGLQDELAQTKYLTGNNGQSEMAFIHLSLLEK